MRTIPRNLIAKPILITLDPSHVEVIQSIFEAFFSSTRVMEIDVPREVKLEAAAVLHKIIVEYERQIHEAESKEANNAKEANNTYPHVQES